MAPDRALFYWINRWPEELSPVFVFFSEATKIGPVKIFLIVLGLALLIYPKTRQATALALLAVALGNGFTEALKTAFPFQRPCVALPDVILYVGKLTTYGTASSHSANMAALAFVFTYFHRWWGAPWIVIAVLTGLSRIYVGVHFPSQVLLGWICGMFCGLLAVKTWEASIRVRSGRAEVPNTDTLP